MNETIQIEPEKLYTVKEICAQFHKHPNTVRDWIKTGKLKALKPNVGPSATFMVRGSDLMQFLGLN